MLLDEVLRAVIDGQIDGVEIDGGQVNDDRFARLRFRKGATIREVTVGRVELRHLDTAATLERVVRDLTLTALGPPSTGTASADSR